MAKLKNAPDDMTVGDLIAYLKTKDCNARVICEDADLLTNFMIFECDGAIRIQPSSGTIVGRDQ